MAIINSYLGFFRFFYFFFIFACQLDDAIVLDNKNPVASNQQDNNRLKNPSYPANIGTLSKYTHN